MKTLREWFADWDDRISTPLFRGGKHQKRAEGEIVIPHIEETIGERDRLARRDLFAKTLASTISILLVVAAVSVLLSTFLFAVLQVNGESMEPSLTNGDILILRKTKRFKPGDLIGLHYEGKILIKRVIGGPGDYVTIDEQGSVTVNGAVIEEPYLIEKAIGDTDLSYPYQVPDSTYFVMGDNRAVSVDSRNSKIGCIPFEKIIGRVALRIYPFSSIQFLQ